MTKFTTLNCHLTVAAIKRDIADQTQISVSEALAEVAKNLDQIPPLRGRLGTMRTVASAHQQMLEAPSAIRSLSQTFSKSCVISASG